MINWYKKIDQIQKDIRQVLIDQAAMKEDLRHHIVRSTNLEDALKPIQKHVHNVQGVAKAIGLLAAIGTIVGAIVGTMILFIK